MKNKPYRMKKAQRPLESEEFNIPDSDVPGGRWHRNSINLVTVCNMLGSVVKAVPQVMGLPNYHADLAAETDVLLEKFAAFLEAESQGDWQQFPLTVVAATFLALVDAVSKYLVLTEQEKA